MVGQGGATPAELFDKFVDELRDRYNEDKRRLKDFLPRASPVEPEWTYDDFVARIEKALVGALGMGLRVCWLVGWFVCPLHTHNPKSTRHGRGGRGGRGGEQAAEGVPRDAGGAAQARQGRLPGPARARRQGVRMFDVVSFGGLMPMARSID